MFDPTKTDLGDLFDDMRQIRESMDGTDAAPQTMSTQDDPNIEAEDFNMEDYRDDDLDKVKSKTEDVPKEVPDADLEQKPLEPKGKKHKTKESKDIKENAAHPLNLCNECSRTFRSDERICLYCESGDVLPICPITEGILELVGEIEGIGQREQDVIRKAVEGGKIPDEWPEDADMIDALSSLEDIIDPMNEPGDVRLAYLRHVIVPKAISVMEESVEEGTENKVTVKLTNPMFNIPTSRDFSSKEAAMSWIRQVGLKSNQYIMSEDVEEGTEDTPADPAAETRRAELKAKMAEKEKAHASEMERMAKELEGMS